MMIHAMIESSLINLDYYLLEYMYYSCVRAISKLYQSCIKLYQNCAKNKRNIWIIYTYIYIDICISWLSILLSYCIDVLTWYPHHGRKHGLEIPTIEECVDPIMREVWTWDPHHGESMDLRSLPWGQL